MKDTTYTVEKNFSGLNCTNLMEPEINHLATEYCVDNYETILRQARKMNGVDPAKVEDLVQDVMVSLLKSENEGEGYDISHSREGSVITVADFVFGRLKNYSRNRKYSLSGCNQHISSKRVGDTVVTVVDYDELYASPDMSGNTEDMDAVQRAFANAHSYDAEIESIEDSMSLRKDVEFCIDFDEVVGINFLNLFRNIDAFSESFDSSIFDGLKAKLKYHDELGQALENALTSAVKHRSLFDEVIAQF